MTFLLFWNCCSRGNTSDPHDFIWLRVELQQKWLRLEIRKAFLTVKHWNGSWRYPYEQTRWPSGKYDLGKAVPSLWCEGWITMDSQELFQSCVLFLFVWVFVRVIVVVFWWIWIQNLTKKERPRLWKMRFHLLISENFVQNPFANNLVGGFTSGWSCYILSYTG